MATDFIDYTLYLGEPGEPGKVGPVGPPGQKGESGGAAGVVYTRWGRKKCPSGTNELYSGIKPLSGFDQNIRNVEIEVTIH